jgi:hypothetical protein
VEPREDRSDNFMTLSSIPTRPMNRLRVVASYRYLFQLESLVPTVLSSEAAKQKQQPEQSAAQQVRIPGGMLIKIKDRMKVMVLVNSYLPFCTWAANKICKFLCSGSSNCWGEEKKRKEENLCSTGVFLFICSPHLLLR